MGIFTRAEAPSEWDQQNAHVQNYEAQLQAARSRRLVRARTDRMRPLEAGTITPQSGDTAGAWKYFDIEVETLFQLTTGGIATVHPVYLRYQPPRGTEIARGEFIGNADGQAFMLGEGRWWVYVPQQTGDPATFGYTLSDVSSQLPAQQAAIAGQAQGSSVQTVQVLNRTSFATAELVTVAAGTPVNASAQAVPTNFSVVIMAKPGNTGKIYIGNSSANAKNNSGNGVVLAAGQFISLQVTNWNLIWLDSDNNGEGASIVSET